MTSIQFGVPKREVILKYNEISLEISLDMNFGKGNMLEKASNKNKLYVSMFTTITLCTE